MLVHPLAGVLSAYGMGLASQAAVREGSLGLALEPGVEAAVEGLRASLAEAAEAQLGTTPSRVEALYAPEMFAEMPNQGVVVKP